MKIFISWSGQLSRDVADVLRNYLPLMLQGINIFMSKQDLESGSRWSLVLAKELEESKFGIICLTPENINSSWILFEAGALTKHLEDRACGLLINDIKPVDIGGPLAQFQHRIFEKDDFFELLKDINQKSDSPLGDRQLDKILEKWWPDIQKEYNQRIDKHKASKPDMPKRTQVEILEEVLLRIRTLEKSTSAYTWLSQDINDIQLKLFDELPFEQKWIFMQPSNIKYFLTTKLPVVMMSINDSQRLLLYEIANMEDGIARDELQKKHSTEDITILKEMELITEKESQYQLSPLLAPTIKRYLDDVAHIKKRRETKKKA